MEITCGTSTDQRRGSDHVSIDVRHLPEDGQELVNSIRRKMETVSSWHCICRVKESLRKANPKAYIPERVSIGPYHHNPHQERLQAMEDHKWRYVFALMNRKPNLELNLVACVVELKELQNRVRDSYEEAAISHISNNDFLQMMFVDGCFIIELFLKYSIKSLRRRNDPIFTTPGMLFDLRCDLILLENQIPLFVLKSLFQVVPIPKQCKFSLPELAVRFFRSMIPGYQQLHQEKFYQESNHLLDLICHCLLPTIPRAQPKHLKPPTQLNCATELQSSGIRLRKGRTENLLDIRFVRGVLEIPPVIMHQNTENLLRNLIALEQCTSGMVHHITSYAVLMKSLVCSENDVKLLQRQDILKIDHVNEKELAKLFEKVCEEVELKESYYDGLCEQVKGYKGSKKYHDWYRRLKRSYRQNPLMRLLLLLAILVLFLTVVGTSFSILSFSLHRL